MQELIQKEDVALVNDLAVRLCVERRLEALPSDFVYPDYGYLCMIEDEKELFAPLFLSYGDVRLVEDIFERIEIVEEDEDCFDVVLVLHADFGIELIIPKHLLSTSVRNRLRAYKEDYHV